LKLQQCTDINECETGENTCVHGQYCANKQGSYRCPGLILSHLSSEYSQRALALLTVTLLLNSVCFLCILFVFIM